MSRFGLRAFDILMSQIAAISLSIAQTQTKQLNESQLRSNQQLDCWSL